MTPHESPCRQRWSRGPEQDQIAWEGGTPQALRLFLPLRPNGGGRKRSSDDCFVRSFDWKTQDGGKGGNNTEGGPQNSFSQLKHVLILDHRLMKSSTPSILPPPPPPPPPSPPQINPSVRLVCESVDTERTIQLTGS